MNSTALIRLARVTADWAGKLWTLPMTALGLVIGCVGYAIGLALRLGTRVALGNNAIQFIASPLILREHALTLGNVILYGRDSAPWKFGAYGDPDVNIGLHEKAHTYQWQALGVLFAIAYLLAGGFGGPGRNRFEHAAQNYGSGRGSWWPW